MYIYICVCVYTCLAPYINLSIYYFIYISLNSTDVLLNKTLKNFQDAYIIRIGKQYLILQHVF